MWNLSTIKEIIAGKLGINSESTTNMTNNISKNISSGDDCNQNGDNYNRVLVIGDIHGHYKKFMSLYNQLNVTDKDLVIFLGDYVDRGPDGETICFLDWIMREIKKDNIIALRGNHEQMMIDFFKDGDFNWIFNGGEKTSKDIKNRMKDDPTITDKVLEFAESLPLSHRMMIDGKDYFFCHAGVMPGVPIEEQEPIYLLWIRDEFIKKYSGDTIVVVGHTPLVMLKPEGSLEMWRRDYQDILNVKNVKPQWRRNGKILMMDTGSYFLNGRISCMDLKSGKIWQSA